MPEIPALARLHKLPELLERPRAAKYSGFRKKKAERRRDFREHVEGIALSDMDAEAVYLFLYRSTYEGLRAWGKEQGSFGRFLNRLTFDKPGYIEIPGRVLLQALKRLNDERSNSVEPSVQWYLRLDLAIEIRDLLKPLAKGVA